MGKDSPCDAGPTRITLGHSRIRSLPYCPTPKVAITALAFGLFVTVGCAAPSLYPRVIHESKERLVRLEARYGAGQEGAAMRFSHPVGLSHTAFIRILQSVHVKPRQWFIPIGTPQAGTSPGFTDADTEYLAEHLAQAFRKARPDEWVLFYLSHPQEEGVVEVTSGGFFVEGAHLHLVLANYRQPITMPFIQNGIKKDPLRPSGKMFYDVIPGPYQTLHTYGRWSPTKPLLAHASELVTDYTGLLQPSGDTARAGGSREKNGAQANGTGTTLDEKFRMLRQLHQDGLITDQEYQLKRGELLDEL